MRNQKNLRILRLLCGLFLCLFTTVNAKADGQKNIVLTLPAETVLAALQKALPLDIPSRSQQLQGDIIVESVDRLVIHNNIISLHGILSGKNLIVTTNLAGQDLQLRIGEVRLPVACDLQTRFDPAKRQLFVSPQFKEPAQSTGTPQDALPSLLGALNGREYAIDLDALKTINLKVGSGSIPVTMKPVSIAGVDNALIVNMLPQIGSRR
ncbi:MAG: hypothetical protein FWD79_04235 [Desulfobulbus sp.]|nr:hypothetical protein [Desulfobulbus sp.]